MLPLVLISTCAKKSQETTDAEEESIEKETGVRL